MSTSLLYHACGVRGYALTKTEFDGGMFLFYVEPQPQQCRCSACGSRDVIRRGSQNRWFRNVPFGTHLTWIIVDLPRLECRQCQAVRQIEISFAEPRRSYTKALARYILDLARHMTIKDIADHLSLGWDTVKEIVKTDLAKHVDAGGTNRVAQPPLSEVRQRPPLRGGARIDEIAVGHGHRYFTVVLDLDSGRVLFVGNGKGAEALLPFWRRLKRARARVKAVAIDMSPAYELAVETNLPAAKLVFDRFHIVKLLNEKLSELRRQLYRQATDDLDKQVLKGTRWLLLKHPENLDLKRNERARLEEALKLNESLATAYYLKEDLRELWNQPGKHQARRFLQSWYLQAMASGIRLIQQFARTLLAHAPGIVAWYDHPISTGPLEGTNNKIKTIQRQHYGLRDQEFFRLKIYALHRTKYALVG
jgi:transposase